GCSMATIDSAAPVTHRRYDAEALRAHRARRANLRRFRHLLLHLLLITVLFLMLYPVIWMVLSSFRPELEIFGDMGFIPTTWTLQNYVTGWNLFGGKTFGDFFINSFIIAGLAVVGNLITCSMAAY